MANTLLTIDMITKEALRLLKNELGFAKSVNRQYDDRFAKDGAKIGDSVRIRKPVRYTVSSGPALSLQDVVDQSSTLTLSNQKHVDFQFSAKEMALSIDAFSDRYVKPAVAALANDIDSVGLDLYKSMYHSTGTPGTTPASFAVLTDAGTKLSNAGAALEDRHMIFDPAASGGMAGALKDVFHPQKLIADQYRKGLLGEAGGFMSCMDQNVKRHTVGSYAGSPAVDGGDQTGASLVTDGWSSGASSLNEGDVFTIEGVFAVNPQSRQSTGQLQEFVVTEDVSDTSGAKTISIAPSIVTSGQYQTVSNSPADDAEITVKGTAGETYSQNIAMHKDSVILGMADLEIPNGVDMADRISDPDSGLSLRIVRDYDINNDRLVTRIDCLFGYVLARPETACRVWG